MLTFHSRRSVVYSRDVMIACSQPLACQAGLEILRRGGNAADAAIAIAAALNVTEPCSCGIGGDVFLLFYSAKEKKVSSINGSGRAPRGLTLTKLREKGIEGKEIPLTNLNSVTVPGAVDAWLKTIEQFGSGRVTIKEILSPAIRLAEDGYPVSEIVAQSWLKAEGLLRHASPNGEEMLRKGRSPRQGEIITMKTLGQTFRLIGEKGRAGFYEGSVAQAIVDLIQSQGGEMTLEDLRDHQSTFDPPIRLEYQEKNIWQCSPNGQGLVTLIALGILQQLIEEKKIRPLETYEHNSGEYLHILIEALRLAFADGRYFISDPQFQEIPVDELLSSTYLSRRIKDFHPEQIHRSLQHGNPRQSSDTVYFTVADSEGNACSFIFSNYAGFGTGAIPRHCGFTLQNRGANFLLEENHPNSFQPGKRPYHTIIPSMITDHNGDLLACFGVMGGFMQPQGQLQVLCNLLHFKMNVQAALDFPRFCIGPRTPSGSDQDDDLPSEVFLEDGISSQAIDRLRSFGHQLRLIEGQERSLFGRGQIIRRIINEDQQRVWEAGSDPRADGHATGW